MTTRFVIAEDNDFFRETIARMLASQDDRYTCVGQARDGAEAIELVKAREPELLILDLRMPRMDGFGVMAALRSSKSRPHVLVLTMNRAEAMMEKALRQGADGYCTKTSGRSALLKAVERVARGDRYISPDMRGGA